MRELLEGLDSSSLAALALIYVRRDHLQSPIRLESVELEAIERLNSSLGECITALETLKGSLVQLLDVHGDMVWRFRHPSIGDAFASLLSRSPELLEVFLLGSSPEDLVRQVTCGEVGYENAVVLRKTFFPLVLRRLDELTEIGTSMNRRNYLWTARQLVHGFLARRCTREFLSLYIEAHPELPDHVASPGLFLSAVSELDVALRLHELGLLSEINRRILVDTVTNYAVSGEDLYALEDTGLRTVFTDLEYESLRGRILSELVPRLDEVRMAWEDNYNSDDPPDQYMQMFLQILGTLASEYAGQGVQGAVLKQVDRTEDWILAQIDEYEEVVPRLTFGDMGSTENKGNWRSIFEDVDL